jgi:hypothetical protein
MTPLNVHEFEYIDLPLVVGFIGILVGPSKPQPAAGQSVGFLHRAPVFSGDGEVRTRT